MSTPLNRFSRLMTLAVPAAGIFTCGQAQAASVDMFLKLDGIDGESIVKGYEKHIEILSWSWGASNSGATAGGAGSGKVVMNDFTITKRLSSASPPLMLSCATGRRIPTATFRLTKPSATGAPQDYYLVTLYDVLVRGYSSSRPEPTATSTDNSPFEKISLIFIKMTMEYRPASFNGQPSLPVTANMEVAP